ncbi:MAG: hypothetical protein EOO71_19735 [Myxococcaceae bacterium]|nr:MAG: hypothetical protein EOO71_19735 [Myxococcaceae bacterium]
MRPHIKERLSTWEGLAELVQLKTEEASDLDFKQEAYASANKSDEKKKKDKVELRRDVVSFSNAEGGAIILGIVESREGKDAELTGIVDFRNAEILTRDVLSQHITPALENRDLHKRTDL